MSPMITLLGLGPGNPAHLTQEAAQLLQNIPEIYLRTMQHPTVASFPAQLQVHSFDELYDSSPSFDYVYAHIIERILELAQRPQGVVYAVPGHPYVAEATCPEIVRRAEIGRDTSAYHRRDEFHRTHIFRIRHRSTASLRDYRCPRAVLVAHVPPFPSDAPALIAQLHSRTVANEVKLTLMEIYPDEHPTRLVHAAGTSQELVEDVPLHAIDQSENIGLLTSFYLPPLEKGTSFESFHEIIAHLRAPNGCPWDREQDHQSLRNNLLEETYETLVALDADDAEPYARGIWRLTASDHLACPDCQ